MRTITEVALSKLEEFCTMANKATILGHPLDQERWFSFVCQTVIDDKICDASTLAEILQDETYLGVNCVWSEKSALELASKYESDCKLLRYYKWMQK